MRCTDKQIERIINALLTTYAGTELEQVEFADSYITLGLCDHRVMVVDGGIGREYRDLYIEFENDFISMWNNNGDMVQYVDPKDYNVDATIAILSFMVMNERMRIDNKRRG